MKTPVIVIGASGLARNVADIADASGVIITAFVDETKGEGVPRDLLGVQVHQDVLAARDATGADRFLVAIGDNSMRETVAGRTMALNAGMTLAPPLVDPAASVSRHASIRPGAIICAGCRIGASAVVGPLAYLAFNTVVSHDCRLGTAVSMHAGASLGGNVTVGDRVMLGLNSSVREGAAIGSDTLVGAGSFVNRDLPQGVVAFGCPARVVRNRVHGQRYLR